MFSRCSRFAAWPANRLADQSDRPIGVWSVGLVRTKATVHTPIVQRRTVALVRTKATVHTPIGRSERPGSQPASRQASQLGKQGKHLTPGKH